jgi:hypothetical protein
MLLIYFGLKPKAIEMLLSLIFASQKSFALCFSNGAAVKSKILYKIRSSRRIKNCFVFKMKCKQARTAT